MRVLVAALLTAAIIALGLNGVRISAQGGSVPISPQTSNRFPPINRADLDEYGKKVYDDHVKEGISLNGAGPVSLRMWDPGVAEFGHGMNAYVRNRAGLPRDLVELVIIATTRELNAEFEYSSHEPAALKAGVSQQTVDVVRFKRSVTGLPERDAAAIQLTREAVGQRKVTDATFARAEKLFGKRALVTMGAIMGEYNAAAILLGIAGQRMPAGRTSLIPAEIR